MKLLNQLNYKKPSPFRDSTLFIIICEGEKREIDYFTFFDRLSKKIRVHPYSPTESKSAPNHVINTAQFVLEKYKDDNSDDEFNENRDQIWLVMDTDHHKNLIHNAIEESKKSGEIKYCISNPCLEVWFYFHLKSQKLDGTSLTCKKIKREVAKLNNNGGFDSTYHPTLLKTAIENSKQYIVKNGYMPENGTTTLHELGDEIYKLVKNVLKNYVP